MKSSVLRMVLAIAAVAGGLSAQEPALIDYTALLRRMVDLDWLWQPPAPGERCMQWSSFDRASEKGPQHPFAWYANDDRGNYVRVEERHGTKEFVMVDTAGPGCVARIWSANPTGTLHFDVDGARVWSVDFAALCSGKIDGVPEPLAGMRSKGGNCHLPIPFAKSLKVSATAGDLYWHVDVVQFAKGTSVPSFSPNELPLRTTGLLERMRKATHAPPLGPIDSPWPDDAKVVGADVVTRHAIAADSVVRWLGLFVNGEPTRTDLVDVLRRTVLRIDCGDELLVEVPVMDFFAAGPEWRRWAGLLLGVGEHGAFCAWPMPFPKPGSIELRTAGARNGVSLRLMGSVESADPLPADTLLFRASYHLVKGTPTRPFSDHLVLDAKGRGRFVGCSLLVRNPSRIWWGEGDEKFTVDGEAFPSWFGTGTEDYFGYAWCSTETFASPFHAQVQCDGPGNFGFTQLHRTHGLDSVPFQSSFRFELERWHWVETTAMDYATVAHWYGASGASSGLPPVPAAAERALVKLVRPPIWNAENVIEGEALRVVSCSGGAHTVHDTAMYEKTFSGDGVRCWYGAKAGDSFVVAVPVAKSARYRVAVAFGKNDDAGIVQCALGGRSLGEPFDGFERRAQNSGPVVLGELDLTAGEVELRLELKGRNPDAKPVHMVAVDYVRLEVIE